MLKNRVRIILSVIGIWKMWQFATPKLTGAERSVNAFTSFGEAFNINGTYFMYFTGVVELAIVAFLAYSLMTRNFRQKIIASLAGNALLLFTMAGAVLIELFVRPGKADYLLMLGSALLVVSILQVGYFSSPLLLKHKTATA